MDFIYQLCGYFIWEITLIIAIDNKRLIICGRPVKCMTHEEDASQQLA